MSTSGHHHRRARSSLVEAVAGNGLLDRRALLGRGVILAGAIGTAPLGSLTGAAAEPLKDAQPTDAPLTDRGASNPALPSGPTNNRRGSRKASYALWAILRGCREPRGGVRLTIC
jgi:sulfane dehydrogenase subunit SoxC